jgi:hypothetical protein
MLTHMDFGTASFKMHIVHVRLHQLDAAAVFDSGVRCGAVADYLFEVESFSLIRHNDGDFLAGLAAAADVYFCFWVFLVAVHNCIIQRFAERQLGIELFSRNTLGAFDQPHQAVHKGRDRLDFAGHPGIDFQDRWVFSAELRLGIRRSIRASHFIHGCLTPGKNAPRVPKLVV